MSKARILAGLQTATLEADIAGLKSDALNLIARPGVWKKTTDNFTSVSIGQSLQSLVRSMYHIDVGAVEAGDIFLVLSQGQLRSDWDFNVECTPWITWTTVANGALSHDGATNHNTMTPWIVGRNLRQTREHYFDFDRWAMVQFSSAVSAVRFHANFRCRSTDPAIDGSGNQGLIIGTGQGGMAAFRLNR